MLEPQGQSTTTDTPNVIITPDSERRYQVLADKEMLASSKMGWRHELLNTCPTSRQTSMCATARHLLHRTKKKAVPRRRLQQNVNRRSQISGSKFQMTNRTLQTRFPSYDKYSQRQEQVKWYIRISSQTQLYSLWYWLYINYQLDALIIIYSRNTIHLYMFRASSAHLQEDIVVYKQHMVPSLSIRLPGGLLIRS